PLHPSLCAARLVLSLWWHARYRFRGRVRQFPQESAPGSNELQRIPTQQRDRTTFHLDGSSLLRPLTQRREVRVPEGLRNIRKSREFGLRPPLREGRRVPVSQS